MDYELLENDSEDEYFWLSVKPCIITVRDELLHPASFYKKVENTNIL